jgi:hypothetical protein
VAEYRRLVAEGLPTPYRPSLTLDDLVGFGPPIATDHAMGRVELAMRSMRVLGGGMPFSGDTGYYNMLHDTRQQLSSKGAVFFSDLSERDWLVKHGEKYLADDYVPRDKTKLAAAARTRQAIIETAVRGLYEAPKYAERTDILGSVASFQTRNGTYKVGNKRQFEEKALSLLPPQLVARQAEEAPKSA